MKTINTASNIAPNNTPNKKQSKIPRPRVSEAPQDIQHLIRPPAIAWPTLLLAAFATALYLYGLIASWNGSISLWLGCAIVSVASFLQFTPLHDAAHRAISSRWDWLNTFVANWCFYFFIPLIISGQSFRYLHMQHHRFANGGPDLDPDDWVSGRFNWHLPLRCMTIFFSYLKHFFKQASSRPKTEVAIGFATTLITIAIAVFAYNQDKMSWLLICMILPIFLSSGWLAFVFDWLPHTPHDVPETEDPYQATVTREGAEWFWTPLLLWQNYHLLHHLYPRVPFYRYARVWYAMRETFMDRGARVVDSFNRPIQK